MKSCVLGVCLLSGGLYLASLAGCAGSSGPERASVSGTVTLDGAPVDQGTITFIPTGPKGGPTSGDVIEKGNYSIAAVGGPILGEHKVEIRALKKTGKQLKVMPPAVSPTGFVDETVEAIPAKYNSSSTLTQTFESGHNKFDFDLKSE